MKELKAKIKQGNSGPSVMTLRKVIAGENRNEMIKKLVIPKLLYA